MSYCYTANRFIITKGVDNTFEFTIKQNDSLSPLHIQPSDTFTAELVRTTNDVVDATIPLTVKEAVAGKVELVVTSLVADSLYSEKGEEVDRNYLKPTYKFRLVCNTVGNGDFIATIRNVYVD